MKTSIKVLITIMSIAIVGLTIGLFVAMQPKEVEKVYVSSLQVLPDDDNLVDISIEGDDYKTYAINLNNTASFAFKYVATPEDLSEYTISVITDNSAISVKSEDSLQGQQSGSVNFVVNNMTTDNEPVTITFSALSGKREISAIVKVLVTKPSTLKPVEGITYNGKEIVWKEVTSNTDNISINSSTVKYKVSVSYKEEGQDKLAIYTTGAGITKFNLEGFSAGFKTGTINTVTVQAIGDNTLTTDSVVSEEYKFYILDTPEFDLADEEILVNKLDNFANAVVVYKKIDDVVSEPIYRQKSSLSDWLLNSIDTDSKIYYISMRATVVSTAPEFDNDKINSISGTDGVEYFDSPIGDAVKIIRLDTPIITLSNNNISQISVGSGVVETYDSTTLTWNHATQDIDAMKKLKYIITISNGVATRNYIVDYSSLGGINKTPTFKITNDILTEVRSGSTNYNTYNITIKAIMPVDNVDLGEKENTISNQMLVLDSSNSETMEIGEYLPAIADYNIIINDSKLTYTIPTTETSIHLIDEIELVFVSNNGDIFKVSSNTSGEVDLLNLITIDGDYDLYIFTKGKDNNVNYNSIRLVKESVYKTIGAVNNLNLSSDGVLTFDEIEGASGYKISIILGGDTYTINQSDNTDFNVIDYLDNQKGYVNVIGGNSSNYQIVVESITSQAGWFGAANSIEFNKLSDLVVVNDGNKIDLINDKIVWGRVEGAISYLLEVYGDETHKSSVIINNSETSYAYRNTEIENVLVEGDNKISITALGLKNGDITILKSNTASVNISKISAINNIAIVNNKLTWNSSQAGNYELVISNNSNQEIIYFVNDGSKTNEIDLTTLNLNSNTVYGIKIKHRLAGYFDSDYSEIMYVSKLNTNKQAIVNCSGEPYIVWEKLPTNYTNIVYSFNGTNTDGNPLNVGEITLDTTTYNAIKISDIKLNGSLGLIEVGDYQFTYSIATTTIYNLADNSAENVAYISSDSTSILIKRLATPSISVSGYNITLSTTDNIYTDKYKLVVVKSDDSREVINAEYSTSNSTINTKDIITEAGSYVANCYSYGNIGDSVDYTLTKYALDSATVDCNITKLNAVELSLFEYNKVNCIKVKYNDLDTITHNLYVLENSSLDYRLLASSEYAISKIDDTYAVIQLESKNNSQYYMNCSASQTETMGYLTSVNSNVVTLNYINYVGSQLQYLEENKIYFSDTIVDDHNMVSKYYVELNNGSTTYNYIITINGENRICETNINGSVELFNITDISNNGLSFVDGKYIFDISWLQSIDIVTKGNEYTISVVTIGKIDGDICYNDVNNDVTGDNGTSITFNYYDTSISGVKVDNNLIIPLSILPSGYSMLNLKLTHNSVDEIYVIDMNSRSTEIVGSRDNSILVTYSSTEISIDLANLEYGNYSLTVTCNKSNNLGITTAESSEFTFSKNAPFGNSENSEILGVDAGNLYIAHATTTREYYIYKQNETGVLNKNTRLGNYKISSSDTRLNIDTTGWSWQDVTNDIYFAIEIRENGKIVSDISTRYHITMLNSTNIVTSLTYVNDSISKYVIEWDSNNMSGSTDLVSAYQIVLTNGVNTKTINIASNTNYSDTNGEYNVAYNNKHYTLTIDHNLLLIDSTQQLTITLNKVIGSTIDSVVVEDNYYITRVVGDSHNITYLPTNTNISVSTGKLSIGSYSYQASSAVLKLYTYDSESSSYIEKYSYTLTQQEITNGVTLNLNSLLAGTYIAKLRYFGNTTNLVNSEIATLDGIVKSEKIELSVVGGKLAIVNPKDETNYQFVILDEYYREITSFDKYYRGTDPYYYIDTTDFVSGNFIVRVTATNDRELSTSPSEKTFYKYKAISDLTRSVTITSEGKVNLILTFTAQNVRGTDIVESYKVIYRSKTTTTTNEETWAVSSLASYYNNGKYTITINNIGNKILELGNEFDVSITSLGNNIYIENLAEITNANIVNVTKISTPGIDSLYINNLGCMVVRGYVYPSSEHNYTVNKAEIKFVNGDNSYLYTIDNFSSVTNEGVTIDFTSEQVYDGTNYIMLPAGQYDVYIAYKSNDSDVITSDSTRFSITKTASVSSIVINEDSISWGTSSNSITYNYVISGTKNYSETGYSKNYIDMKDNIKYISGNYSISIQTIQNLDTNNGKYNELKSQYSVLYDFTKLQEVELKANLVKTESEYYINAQIFVPENNFDTSDRAKKYYFQVNNRQYVFNANTSTASLLDTGSDIDSAISVEYNETTRIYTIKINIVKTDVLNSTGNINGSDVAGKLAISGISDEIDSIELKVTKVVGNNAVSINTQSIAKCSVSLTKLISSNVSISIVDGILNISNYDVTNRDHTIVSFYEKIGEGVFNTSATYIWEVNGSTIDLTSGTPLLSNKEYLITVQHFGNVANNIIDSNIQYLQNSNSRVIRVVDTPKIYIEDGVLKWTNVGESAIYELSIINGQGNEEVKRLEQCTLDTTALNFVPGEYNITIRAIISDCIKSSTSETFTAYKLASPTIYDLANEQAILVKEDRTTKLRWYGIGNASGYELYDYYDVDKSLTFINLPLIAGDEPYEYDINLDTDLTGRHYYYLIAKGSENTVSLSVDNSTYIYANSGYLDSSNSISNNDLTKITSTIFIINSTQDIYVRNGVVEWKSVANVDYYKIYITAVASDNTESEYVTSTPNNYLDLIKIDNLLLHNAKYLKFKVENKTITGDYTVVSTTTSRKLHEIILFNRLQNEMYTDICIDKGMIRYTILSSYIDNFISLINSVKEDSLSLTIADVFGDNILNMFITPTISINGIKYILGSDITNQSYIYLNSSNETLVYNGSVLAGTDKILVYIPLPESLPFGNYNIQLSARGNTTTTSSEIALINSLETDGVVGYKLDSPKNPFIEYENHEVRDGVLKFTPTPTKSSSTNYYVKYYKLRFEDTSNSANNQTIIINLTHDVNELYTDTYAGYIDITNNIISIDIYNLFILNEEDANYSSTTEKQKSIIQFSNNIYPEFKSLSYDVNYIITISAMGEQIWNQITNSEDLAYKYFDSNYSNLKASFKILSAPTITIQNKAIQWIIKDDVISYDIYFYDLSGNEVYREELTDLGSKSVYSYTNIRNNENLPAGVYSIKVVAIGNCKDKMSSRISDAKDFYAQKLDAVNVVVENGLYQWENAERKIKTYSSSELLETYTYYPYYYVDIYKDGVFYKTEEVTNIARSNVTTYELPEDCISRDTNTNQQIEYKIIVYANTSGSDCLLTSDDNTGNGTRIRSDKISSTFKIVKDGIISWTDIYSSMNDYIVFIYKQGVEQLIFTSGKISGTQIDIYNLRDKDGELFPAEDNEYRIKVKSINKNKYSDSLTSSDDSILRSVFTDEFSIRLIAQPDLMINEGEISWNTKTKLLGEELTKTRIVLSGKFIVDGSETIVPVWLEFDKTITNFTMSDIAVYSIKEGETLHHYLYVSNSEMYEDSQTSTTSRLQFIEGETYSISMRFIGYEYTDIIYNNSNSYLISTKESITNFKLLVNPKAPINPRVYQYESDEASQAIYNNIPTAYEHKNYIYFARANGVGYLVRDYNVEIYIRDKANINNSELLYIYQIRYIGTSTHVNILNVQTNVLEDVTNKNYLTYLSTIVTVDGLTKEVNGAYIALDQALNEIIAEGYDFTNNDICVYVESVGSTTTSPIYNEIGNTYLVTHHYLDSTKLDLNSEDYVMSIDLPNTPQNLAYDGYGKVSWDNVDNKTIYYELVVAYKKNDNTVENANYSNISRMIYDSSKSENTEFKNTLMLLLDINNEDVFNELFSVSATEVYYIDKISINKELKVDGDKSYYMLKYLTGNIVNITLRAIGTMSVDSGSSTEVLDTFVSKPTSLHNLGGTFNLFNGGDGTLNNPFILKNFETIAYYLEENCYFDYRYSDYYTGTDSFDMESWTNQTKGKSFNGIFNGNNNTIEVTLQNYEKDGSYYAGLFYAIGENAMLMNLKIIINNGSSNYLFNDANEGTHNAGAIAVYNYGTITNIKVAGQMYIIANQSESKAQIYVGGIVYTNLGNISYSDVSIAILLQNVTSTGYVGGITAINGDNSTKCSLGNIVGCSFSGLLYAHNMGGIVGDMQSGRISYSKNVGYMIYAVDNSISSTSYAYVGGLISQITNRVGQSTDANTITINNSYVELQGLIVGLSASKNIQLVNATDGTTTTITISNYSLSNNQVRFGGINGSGGYKGTGSKPITISTCYVYSSNTIQVEKLDTIIVGVTACPTSEVTGVSNCYSFSGVYYHTNVSNYANESKVAFAGCSSYSTSDTIPSDQYIDNYYKTKRDLAIDYLPTGYSYNNESDMIVYSAT